MKDISKKVFRWAPKARFVRGDGPAWEGRGVVARIKSSGGQLFEGQRHEAGLLESPLFVFTGWAEQAKPGDILEQGGVTYTILEVRELTAGDKKVCSRFLLERQVAVHDGT